MEMHQIRYFLALAEALHFSRAADRCNVSQPSLSRAIRKLEEEMGGALFERRPGSVHLTELGRHLQSHFQRALDYISAIKDEAAAFLTFRERNLRIGIMSAVFHPQFAFVLSKLSDRFPRVTLHIERGSADHLQSRLLSGEIDIAILCRRSVRAENVSISVLYEEKYSSGICKDELAMARRELRQESASTYVAGASSVATLYDLTAKCCLSSLSGAERRGCPDLPSQSA